MPRLSFCIPTRNFGPFIGETLKHLVRERGVDDEIVIVDGSSTDDTAEIVGRFQALHKNIIFEQRTTNGGVDRDLAHAVSLARGEYCWLFSADDGLVSGAAAKVQAELDSGCDVLLLERIDCDQLLTPIRRRRWMRAHDVSLDYRLADEQSLLSYLRGVRSLGGMFSYVSSILVRRQSWDAALPMERHWGTNYAHVGRLFAMLRQQGRTLRIAPLPVVLCRGDNDSFAREGRVRRFLIDVDGYAAIGEDVFASQRHLREAFFAAFRRDHGFAALCGIRMRATEDQWQRVLQLLAPFEYSKATLQGAGTLGRIGPLVVAARALRNHFQRALSPPRY
jgi:abequosyltransferase